jgi:carotenoid cleavage dioxygenase-like enzyme
VPKEPDGTLYRVAPGQKENHGVMLRHFFDGDAFVSGFSALTRHDLKQGTSRHVEACKNRVLDEAVFVPHPGQNQEDRGWLLMQGYDAERDENYLDVRDAETLEMVARVWTGQHFPLGFHGNFTPMSYVAI